jgi:hypothetical protein
MGFPQYGQDTAAPADEGAVVTTSDTVDIPGIPACGAKIFVGTGGNITVDLAKTGTTIQYKNIANGTWLPLLVRRVRTATTAADIVANW